MKLSYKQKLFSYLFFVFALFTTGILLFQQYREKGYKKEKLRTMLDGYAGMVARQLENGKEVASVEALMPLFPGNLRLTVIGKDGAVLYDNDLNDSLTDNHLLRPEIEQAKAGKEGFSIRHSASLGSDYFYFAKSYPGFFVRVALPYDVEVRSMLKADHVFVYFAVLLFLAAIVLLICISEWFGRAITGLRNFIFSAENHSRDYEKIRFPNTELGEISRKIVSNYKELEEGKKELAAEREKLIRHFRHADEGIAIFSSRGENTFANSHFIQYLNLIADAPVKEAGDLFRLPEFEEVNRFLFRCGEKGSCKGDIPVHRYKIAKGGHCFEVKLLIFNKESFEVILTDISRSEKTRILKQEMTGNIAHELKTPVSSIRGYLETLLLQKGVDPEKQRFFMERAYSQAIRLSDLIRDIGLITKIEEASDLFEKEEVNIGDTVNEAVYDLQEMLAANGDTVENLIRPEIGVEGYKPLLYAVFRNLIENSVHYAGSQVTIRIECYTEDSDYYYFSYSDNGCGIGEEHLKRIFERFYRVNEGRSRANGGSGLGLSIVKNAILLHKGEISAKNRREGGLEILFSLRKTLL